MKNNLIYIALIGLLITFSACEKDEENQASYEPKDAPALVSKVSSTMEADYGNSKSTRNYIYDEENKLTTVFLSYQFFRDGEMVQDDKDTINYIYNTEDIITEIIRTGSNWPHTKKYTYSGNKVTMIESYFNGEEYIESFKTESISDADGNTIEEQNYHWDDNMSEWYKYQTYTINEWEQGNLVKTIGYNPNSQKSASLFDIKTTRPRYKNVEDTVVDYETIYTYDVKISPHAYSSINVFNNSRNLLLSYESTRIDGRYSWNASYNYEFGDNGFPSKETELFEFIVYTDGEDPRIDASTYTTEYEYIDLK